VQPPETRYAARPDGVNIAYQVVGDGPVDVVYAPGFISHLDLQWTDPGFSRFLERLASFARLITFDKPGTGVSDPVDHLPTLEERVEDIRIVMDAAGSEQAHVMGFSESGATCILFAASDPGRVRSLILYGSFPRGGVPGERPPELDEAEYASWCKRGAEVNAGIDELIDHWGEGRIVDLFAPSAANRLQRRFWATFERAAASPRMAHAVLESARMVDVVEFMPLVRVPTLILHRVDDFIPVMSSRFMAARIPGARLVELPGADHAFWFGDFDQIVDEIETFVTGARAPVKVERSLATVLFTDIVRSTERAAELGDRRWRDLLERHDAVTREQVSAFGGRVVKSLGDGALAVFDGPARAIRCAESMRDELRGVDVSARFGIHTGECELIGDDVGGMAVHIAARVMSQADADEILVSSTVADLVVGSDLYFEERGTHELKGVPGQWRLLAAGPDRRALPRGADLAGGESAMRPSDRLAVSLAQRMPRAMRAVARMTRPAA
jgi:class 3 adenylate cyclase